MRYRFNYRQVILLLGMMALAACHKAGEARKQIREAETSFAAMAAREGVQKAFLAFADDSAVISRAGRLWKGKKGIAAFYEALPYRSVQLSWTPDTVIVSADADLGYTYGSFQFRAIDSLGKPVASQGIFHTVWKKQPDGSWKYVFD